MRQKKQAMLRGNPLPEDADALVALAESIATVLSEKHNELGISTDIEALLRASIAAATFAIDTYLAVLSGIQKSPEAFGYVAQAKTRCDRNIRQLRRRVTRSISQLCRHMNDKDLVKVANYAL